jgi:hypothetical protein
LQNLLVNKLAILILLIISSASAFDKYYGYTSSLPGAIKFNEVVCKKTYVESRCCNAGGKNYDYTTSYTLPTLYVLEKPKGFNARVVPYGVSEPWTETDFTFGDKDYNLFKNPLLKTTTTCEEGASVTITSEEEFVWYQLVETPTGFSVNYLGPNLPKMMKETSYFHFQSCSEPDTRAAGACNALRPTADAYFLNLIKTGNVPGRILETWGADGFLPFQGDAIRMKSMLYKVDPRSFFSGNLPVSWFTDDEAILLANARDSKGRLLEPYETFVTSSAKLVPMYLGDGQYMPDETRGYQFTDPDGKYLAYWASGSQIWTVEELKAMENDALMDLPLPWMKVPLNQDDHFKPEWKAKDHKLHALSYGSDKPPIPPDRVLNLNPPDLQECPDMYQYYQLFKNCADKLLNTDDDVRVTGLMNFMDQAAIDMDRDANQQDNTPYGEDGQFSPKTYKDPPPSKQYDINSLQRTNPEGKKGGDPYLATSFWMKMRFKKYCKYEWAGGCKDDCAVGGFFCDGGASYTTAWWADVMWANLGALWDVWNPTYEDRTVDVTGPIKNYLDRMKSFFEMISVPRDLLGADSPLNIGFRLSWAYPLGAHREIFPYSDNYGKFNSDIFVPATFPDNKWFGGYGDDGTFSWIANISKDGYDAYKELAKEGDYNWKVYVGNPGRKGLPYTDEKEFVKEGYYDPLTTYVGDRLFSSLLTNDDGFRFGIIQSYPILFTDNEGEVIPLGELKVHYRFYEDQEQSYSAWIGNNFNDNELVHNNAPIEATPENDTYDPNSAEYLTDALDPEERDELTWGQKKHAMWRITKMIATSEGLDLMMHVLYENRKEIWYFAQKYGLEKAIRSTARWAKKAYRAYSSYRQTMDQARRVRDVARRLAGSRDLLQKTSGDIWNYYKNFEWSKLRPDNLTSLLPMQLFQRQDLALWFFTENISDIANESSKLSQRIESYYTTGTGKQPGLVFLRREQEHIASIAANNSTYSDEKEGAMLAQATASTSDAPNPLTNDPVHLYKLSGVLRGAGQNISGTGLWLDNNYTRAAFATLTATENETKMWMSLRDRVQWQYNNFGSIFTSTQKETKVDGPVGSRLKKAGLLFRTPIKASNLEPYEDRFQKNLSSKSKNVITCGGQSCFEPGEVVAP